METMPARIEKYPIIEFAKEPIHESIVVVPAGAKFLKVKVLPDGIYAFFELPVLQLQSDDRYIFIILGKNVGIPPQGQYVDILDLVIEMKDGQQGTMIYPIYMYKKID